MDYIEVVFGRSSRQIQEILNKMNDNTPKTSPKCTSGTRAKGYLCVLITAAVLCIIAGIICSALAIDSTTRYFTIPEASIATFAVFALCTVLALAAFFIFANDEVDISSISIPKRRYLPILEMGTMMTCLGKICSPILDNLLAASNSDDKNSSLTAIALMLLLVSFAFSFAYSVRFLPKYNRTFALVTGIGRIVFFLYIITTLYFDLSVELNSPFKLIVQFGAVAGMIQTCADIRGAISGVTKRAYVAAKALSMTFGALSFVFILVAFVKNAPLPDSTYLYYSTFFLAISISNVFEIAHIALPPKATSQVIIAEDIQASSEETHAEQITQENLKDDDSQKIIQENSQDAPQDFEERNDEI